MGQGASNDHGSVLVATCSVAGCSRNTWNGQPGQQCCRTCYNSDGGSHGPDCDTKSRLLVATCSVAGCSRNTWNGQAGQQCCRTCHTSNGSSHGPDCNKKAGHLQASLAPGVGSAAPARPAVPSAAPAGLAAGLTGSTYSPAGGRKRKGTVDHYADDARSRWTSPRQAGKELKKLFDVDSGSEEFQDVQKHFMATMAGKATIHRIQRVENGHQYEAFLQQKETITEEIADLAGVQCAQQQHCSHVVKLLFHGTKEDSSRDIIHGKTAGFEPMASGARIGAIWGHGVYFARDAAYSHDYCEELPSGERQMLLNHVLVGLSTQGKADIKMYPKIQIPCASNQSSRYHSLVDNPQSPTIFVVSRSNQAYPAYLITYRHESPLSAFFRVHFPPTTKNPPPPPTFSSSAALGAASSSSSEEEEEEEETEGEEEEEEEDEEEEEEDKRSDDDDYEVDTRPQHTTHRKLATKSNSAR